MFALSFLLLLAVTNQGVAGKVCVCVCVSDSKQTVFSGKRRQWTSLESYEWSILKIIILCIWCNRICWHALMFKKHIIFQILYSNVGPLCSASQMRCFGRKSLLPTSTVCSDWPNDPKHCDWSITTSTHRKCNAPYHKHELQLYKVLIFSISSSLKGEQSCDWNSDEARMCLHTSCD